MNKTFTLILTLLFAQLAFSQSNHLRNVNYQPPVETEEGVSPDDLLKAEWAYLNQFKFQNGVSGTRATGVKLDSMFLWYIDNGVFQIGSKMYNDYDAMGRVIKTDQYLLDWNSPPFSPLIHTYRQEHYFGSSPMEMGRVFASNPANTGWVKDSVWIMKNNMLLDTLVLNYFLDTTNNIWGLYRKVRMTYNSSGQILEVKEEGDGTATGWGVKNHRIYSYNQQGDITEVLIRTTNSSGVLYDQKLYQYTYTGNLLSGYLTLADYQNASGSLQNETKGTTTYNSFQLPDSAMHFSWNGSWWILRNRTIRTYDATGLLLTYAYERFNASGSFDVGIYDDFFYTNSVLDSVIERSNDGSNLVVTRRSYPTYSQLGWKERDSLVLYYLPNTLHIISEYNSAQQFVGRLEYSEINGALIPQEKRVYEYDALDRVLTDSLFVYNGTSFEIDVVNKIETDSTWMAPDLYYPSDTFFFTMQDIPVQITESYRKKNVNGSLQFDSHSELFWSTFTPNSVRELGNTEVEVFPNPCINQFSIKREFNGGQLHVYNTAGQLVIIQQVNHNEVINVKHLPRGSYFIQVLHENNSYSGKIIKN